MALAHRRASGDLGRDADVPGSGLRPLPRTATRARPAWQLRLPWNTWVTHGPVLGRGGSRGRGLLLRGAPPAARATSRPHARDLSRAGSTDYVPLYLSWEQIGTARRRLRLVPASPSAGLEARDPPVFAESGLGCDSVPPHRMAVGAWPRGRFRAASRSQGGSRTPTDPRQPATRCRARFSGELAMRPLVPVVAAVLVLAAPVSQRA
jgi:hypothetical protein